MPVRAWIVTMEGDEFEIDADAIAWTRRAVHISYIDRFERPDTAWVWAGRWSDGSSVAGASPARSRWKRS